MALALERHRTANPELGQRIRFPARLQYSTHSGTIARNVHKSDSWSARQHACGRGLQKFLLVYASLF